MSKMQQRSETHLKAFSDEHPHPEVGGFKWHRQVGGWMLQRRLIVFAMGASLAVVAMVSSLPIDSEGGGNAQTQVNVGATVLRHIDIRMLTAPRTIQISAADISRGYVDAPMASTLEIRSNSPTGYLLVIDSQADFSRGAEVTGTGGVASLGSTGGVLSFQASGSGMQTTPVVLSFRILLSGAARPGIYPWPIQISVLPV